MSHIVRVVVAALSFSAGGCAIMPDLPPDWALPMQEILLHTACELQGALRDLNGHVAPGQFDPTAWNIKVTLNPKVDADIQPGVGLTRRVPNASATRFGTLVVGGGSGVTTEMKGNHSGSVDFKFDSDALMRDPRLPCAVETPSYHSLTKHLAIRDWLFRSVEAAWTSGSRIDNPSFSADVFIKFNGSASWTYTFPPGTDLLTLGGFYQLDENLAINFTPKTRIDKFTVVTLPVGGPGRTEKNQARPIASNFTILENQSESLQQIRQQLQNLRSVTQ